MQYEEFHRQIGKAGLKLREFAALIGMNPRSLSNLSHKEEVPSHLAIIACLLGTMADHRLDFRTAIAAVKVRRKKPRGSQGKSLARAKGPSMEIDLATREEHNRNILGTLGADHD